MRKPAVRVKAPNLVYADQEVGAAAATGTAGVPESAAAQPPKPTKPSSQAYQLDFNRNTHQLTPPAERTLSQIADLMSYYPMETLKIQGFAQATEDSAPSLAERRAKMVAGLLINKYQVDPKKIQVASAVVETASYKVQVNFIKDQ